MGTNPHILANGDLIQDWSNTNLITADDNWDGVTGIVGYLGDIDSNSPTNVDPRTLTGAALGAVDVIANATNTSITNGGVAEFHIADPTVALQGSGTADAPSLVLYLDATGRNNVRVKFDARDIDGTDNAVQQIAVQYRLGNSASWTNVPGGYAADVTTGGTATQVTPFDLLLPAEVNGRADLQVRILTTNAGGNDEWVGIDNINVSSAPAVSSQTQTVAFAASSLDVAQPEGNAGVTLLTFTVERTGGTDGQINFSGTIAAGETNGGDFPGGTAPVSFTGSIPAGASSATVTVQVAGDTVVEDDESFTLTLTSATNTSGTVTTNLGSNVVAEGTIVNDDVPASAVTINGITILDQAQSLQGSVTTPVATNSLQVTRKAEWISGDGAGGAESIAFDPSNDRAYVTNAKTDTISILDLSNPFAPTKIGQIILSGVPAYGEVNSVAVKNGIIAVAIQNIDGGEAGFVVLFDSAGHHIKTITVGVLPDQLTFSPDGKLLLVANEAEPFNDAAAGVIENASGSVTIIDMSGGPTAAAVRNTIGFTALDGNEALLSTLGIKIFGGNANLPAPTASQDIEPEYVAVSLDGTKAYVTLQEVNAVAVIDLTDTNADRPVSILPMGSVDFSLPGNEGDFSDRDGPGGTASISIGNAPVHGLLQPDAIATFQVGGETYFITANEGDSRIVNGGADGLNEVRASALGVTDADYARLTLDSTWSTGPDDLYAFGGRGFSIFKQQADGTIIKVEETGGDFEQIIASLPNANAVFNGENGGSFDTRSDNKAAEPEGVDIAVVDGKTYAFVGLERLGGLMVWDVSTPTDAKYVTYIAPSANGYGPEVVKVVSAADSPTGRAFVMTANEVSGSVTIYDLEAPGTTKISAIQGTGAASTMQGQTVTIEAIVVGDFQNGDADGGRNLGGFWLQEEIFDQDGNPLTSEGIFVSQASLGVDVQIGDRVRVTGTVVESFGNTEINATSVQVTQAGAVADINTMAVDIDLPALGVQGSGGVYTADLEAYEGMLVRIPETMTITEQFNFDRFGETRLTQGARPESYTMSNDPSVSGYDAHLRDIASRSIIFDDGRSTSNPNLDNVITDGDYNTATAPRMGDTVTGLTGVLDFDFSQFRIHAVQSGPGVNDFVSSNPRPATPADVGGTLKVASFNVLNYFTTLNNGATSANGLAPRGAETAAEFARQTEKLVNTIAAMDADVLGLMEIENNFLAGAPGNAIEYLVNQLNAKLGAGTYAWVNPGQQFVGGDAIAVGFIYQTASVRVTPGTQVAILDDSDLSQAFLSQSSLGHVFNGVNTSRAAVAVTFEEVATGGDFTAVVNHFKSKGTSTDSPPSGADVDHLDGAGAWNQQRTLAAEALRDWIATKPTGTTDSDVLILGDLNAYAKEGPIKVLTNAGYTDQGAGDYGYVFDGQTGSLDHILTNGSLSGQVTGHTNWHINADEADAIDYQLNLAGAANSAIERDPAIFNGNVPARVSDHDPVIVGLNLTEEPIVSNYKLQILHASDFEAGLNAVDRAGNFAAIVDYLEETYANSITLSSGDNFLPSPFFNAGSDASLKEIYETALETYYHLAPGTLNITPGFGTADISMLNIIGVQASAIGNHEFDAGTNPFAAIIRQTATFPGAQFPYLAANLDFSADPNLSGLYTNVIQNAENYTGFPPVAGIGKKIAPATVITEGGEKIGVVGATTQIVESISSTGGVEVIGDDVNDMAQLAAIIQPTIDALIAQGINKIILVSHLQQISFEKALAPLLHGVDIIIGGGSNTRMADAEDVTRGLRPGDTPDETYPYVTTNADGKPLVIVNTDGEYSYVGRLVVEFDANGDIVPSSIDPNVSGAFATTDEGVADLYANPIDVNHDGVVDANDAAFANGSRGDLVNDIAQGVGAVIDAQDGNLFGKTSVYLEGRRGEVRTEETNLGDLTADANLWYAKKVDDAVLVSIKNGGGLRDSIGRVEAVGSDSVELPPEGNADVGKAEGDVSQLDIANSLRFNNALSLVTVTADQMLKVLEHAVAATTATATPGQFAQIGGIAYSFDKDLPVGNRVLSAALIDENGNPFMALVENGELVVDPAMAIRVVTLSFLLTGGDGYPFASFIAANPAFANVVNLTPALVPDADEQATFAAQGTEQDAFAEYMAEFYSDTAYAQADTDRAHDTRIQNLDFRSDTVLVAESVNKSGGAGDDVLTGALADDILSGNGGNDKLYGYDGNDLLRGGGGDDLLDGGAGNDTLLGGSGNDDLRGGAGNDLLEGGRGNDLLAGGAGSDQYSYEEGDGSDTIVEAAAPGDSDTLVFQDIDSDAVTLHKHGNDVEIVLGDGSVITLKDQLAGGGVEHIAFADGETLDGAEIADAITNRGPVASGETLATVAEDAPSFLIPFATLLANDSDADLDALSITALANVVGGSAVIEGTNVRFTPAANFNGAASFTYTVADGHGGTATATASFTVTPVNDAPVIAPVAAATTAEDAPATGQIVATDVDGDPLSYAVKNGAGPQHGQVTIDAAGHWTYTPATNYHGGDSFTVVVGDGQLTTEAVVNLTITPVNDAPTAVADTGTAGENEAKLFDLVANDTDVDGDALTLSGFGVTGVSGISLTPQAAEAAFSISGGKLAFNPGGLFDSLGEGQTATVTLNYSVKDAQGASATGQFTLTVTGEAETNVIVGDNGSNALFGTNGVDVISAGGGSDFIFGRDGNDVIDAGSGADFVFGGAGNDVIYGGAGNDTLMGDAGDDILAGGAGNDLLYGGAGNDTFVFSQGDGRDIVFDFKAGAGTPDVIELQRSTFADFAALMQSGVTNTIIGAQISYGDGSTMTLVGVHKADLSVDDFRFA